MPRQTLKSFDLRGVHEERLSYFSPLVLLPHAAEEPQAAELPQPAVLALRPFTPPDHTEIHWRAPDSGLSFHWLEAFSSTAAPQTLVRLQVVLFHSALPGWSKIPCFTSGL